MTQSTRRRAFTRLRTPIIGLVAAAIAAVAPGVAHAEPPTNDDFDTATTVTALPFSATQDTTQATTASDDPTDCYSWADHTVWFSYTAPADAIVKTSVTSTSYPPLIAVYTGERGALVPVPGGCSYDTPLLPTIHVTAGETYHFLLGDFYYGGEVTFGLTAVPPAPNDDFAAAVTSGFPAAHTADLSRASAEKGEPASSCDPDADRSVWYRYTPDRTRSVAVRAVYGQWPGVTVYRGATPDALTELDCVPSGSTLSAVFTAEVGTTYHLKVSDDAVRAAWFDLRLTNAPALTPGAYPRPEYPSTFDEVQFHVSSGDGLGRPLVSGEVRFGDGTSAPITGDTVVHRYAADGRYQVEVTGSTADGRTGTGVRTLTVETHDVTLSGFTVPTSARAGQTKPVSVTVTNNTGHAETVRVELLRLAENGYFERVGTLIQWVAGRSTAQLPFAYTYTAADVAAGKVAFQVTGNVSGSWDGDHNPADNQLGAVTTTVRAGAAGAI
jgi:hypothetical protein